MNDPRFLSGKLLLAMPGMADPRFDRAVIAMAVHDEHGAVGIGIGQLRAGIRFRSLLKQLDVDPGEARPIARSIMAGRLSRAGDSCCIATIGAGRTRSRSTGPAGPLYAMTGTLDVLKAIAEGSRPEALADRARLCGLGEGQLDDEMTRHGWFAAHGGADLLFDTPTAERWDSAVPRRGNRSAPAGRRNWSGVTYKEFFIFAFGARRALGRRATFHLRRMHPWPRTPTR